MYRQFEPADTPDIVYVHGFGIEVNNEHVRGLYVVTKKGNEQALIKGQDRFLVLKREDIRAFKEKMLSTLRILCETALGTDQVLIQQNINKLDSMLNS